MKKSKNIELDQKIVKDELNNANSDITNIYNIIMSEELLSYARALKLSNDTTEIMTTVDNIIDKVDEYYKELYTHTKKLTIIMSICAIMSMILMSVSTSLAFITSMIGIYFAVKSRDVREKLLDKSFKESVKKSSIDITNISLNIVTFTKKKIDVYSKLPKLEQLRLLKHDVDVYLTEEERNLYNFDFSELEQLERTTINADTTLQETLEIPVQETEMKLTRIPKSQKNNKK